MENPTLREIKQRGGIFRVRTETGLTMRNEITPEEFGNVERIEWGDSDIGMAIEVSDEQMKELKIIKEI